MGLPEEHKLEFNGAFIVSREFMSAYTKDIAEYASKKAIEAYRIEQAKKEKLSVPEIAREQGCTPPTVISWISPGLKKGKIKLKATRKGTRSYLVSRFDLDSFLTKKNKEL